MSSLTITPDTPAKWDSVYGLTEARHRINQERLAGIPRDQAGRITLFSTYLRWSY
jgi:hypothetical protein